jgi:hypothetical protein
MCLMPGESIKFACVSVECVASISTFTYFKTHDPLLAVMGFLFEITEPQSMIPGCSLK